NCGKVGHKARYCKEKNVAMGANALPIKTCYDYGEQGHTKNRCPKKVKQEELGEVRVIMEYLVNISKKHAFWSLNKYILKITVLASNSRIHQRRHGVSVPALTKDHKENKLNTLYPVKTNMLYWK
nr:hypothetical protein [Tanacetum cinerariifolium]